MSKLIDLTGLTNFASDIKSWVNTHFLRKEEVPAGSTPSTTTPKMDGTASVGSENAFARGDHRHPSDTSKVDKVEGKGLSTNDYDNTARDKVDAIPANPKYTDTVYDDTVLAGRVSTIESKESGWDAKQEALESGTNIKTINNLSILGEGNITIQGGSGGDENVIESISVNGTELTPDEDKNVDITVPAAQVNADWNADSGVSEILNKPIIPVVPTNVSDFINDAGYLTSAHEVPSGGNAGQVLAKNSATDYDLKWTNQTQTYPSAYCTTSAGTAAKVASCSLWVATANSYLHILIGAANTSASALTLNVNSTGAKPIYINGTASSSSNYTLPAGSYIIFYDGTNYYFNTDGTIPKVLHKSSTTGLVKNDGTIDTNTYAKYQVVSALPANPESDTLYLIPES